MTNPRWEVESFFDGFGGALFDLYCLPDTINAEDVVKHVLVVYGLSFVWSNLSPIRFLSLRMKLIFDFLGMADWWCTNTGFLAVFFL